MLALQLGACLLSALPMLGLRQQAPAPAPRCLGPVCNATLHVFQADPNVQIVALRLDDGQARAAGYCDPCLDCRAFVRVRINPAAIGWRATVWEWGHVPSDEEQDQVGGVSSTDLTPGDSAARRKLENECGGLMSVGPGRDVLTIDVTTPATSFVVTVWLACAC